VLSSIANAELAACSGAGGSSGTGGGANAGGASSGGRASTGGTTSTGGSLTTGGASSTDAGSCQTGEKSCGGVCSPPAPSNGCALTGCVACPGPAPSGGVLACDNTAHVCSFVCLSGYTKQGSQCVSNSGAGGSSGSCTPSACPSCGIIDSPCCTNGRCGCTQLGIPGTCI
jgi:hypothetical protein